jgi:hypothetical protein
MALEEAWPRGPRIAVDITQTEYDLVSFAATLTARAEVLQAALSRGQSDLVERYLQKIRELREFSAAMS